MITNFSKNNFNGSNNEYYIEEIFLSKKERFHSAGYRAQVLSIAGRMLCHLSLESIFERFKL